MDWKLDSNDDLDTEDGDIAWVTGADAVAQHCTIRLRTVLGEYWLNQNIGIDYFGKVLVKNPNMVVVQSIFRRTILGTPGVIALLSFSMSLNRTTRTLSVEFRANSTEGPFDYSEEFVLS
jgi:hypothetical protein